jgi:S-adenosylmethionine:tRNA ribosyltransferase-isomerase
MKPKDSNTPPTADPTSDRTFGSGPSQDESITAWDYELPSELIANEPAQRGTSRLLVAGATGEQRHRNMQDLPDLLEPGDALIVNNTRVLAARLFGRRPPGGGKAEILLVERLDERRWQALLRPAKKLRRGAMVELAEELTATVETQPVDGLATLLFSRAIDDELDQIGHVPLPPYIARPDNAADRERYQTVYASIPGAVAAPTAGLHFDRVLLDRLAQRGIEIGELTLHVGIGTFRPVEATSLDRHEMHEERYHLPAATCELVARTRRRGARVVAVGTTVVRALESAALRGPELEAHEARTALFIRPGFRFAVVDALLTNFHLPRSTLLVLVAAFAGRRRIFDAYAEAIERRYRFYSYGDAMLLDARSSRARSAGVADE